MRYAAKFLSKNYRDKDHFEEALMSLQERCSAVKNDKQLREGCQLVADYYTCLSNRPLSFESVKTVFYTLKNSRSITFEQLGECVKYLKIVKSDDRGGF